MWAVRHYTIDDTPQKVTKDKTPKRNPNIRHSADVEVNVKFTARADKTSSLPTRQRSTRRATANPNNLPESIPAKVRRKDDKDTKPDKKVQKVESPVVVEAEVNSKAPRGRLKSRRRIGIPETDIMTIKFTTRPQDDVEKTPSKPTTQTPLQSPLVWTPVGCTPCSHTSASIRRRSQGTPAHMKKNPKGETTLQMAVIKGDYDAVRSLLEQGAEVNTKDNAGWTPLHEASNHGYVRLVELLLDSGAVINVPGYQNDTPLHDAVQMNRIEVVRLLVLRGADKQAKNLSGHIPSDLAKTPAMREMLDETSADSQLDSSVMVVPSTLAVGPVVLLATGLAREDRAYVQKCATLLHGEMVMDYCNEVTHLITSVNRDGQCPRTLKFLQTLLMGKWIVNKEWAEICLEYNERVSEEAFEVPGCSTNPNLLAPNRSRINSQQQLPGLFDGCHFFLQGNFSYPTPSRSALTELIQAGGGHLLTRLPKAESTDEYEVTVPYHAKAKSALSRCSHYIVTDSRENTLKLLHPRLCKTTAIWLMDCIARFELVDHVDETTKK